MSRGSHGRALCFPVNSATTTAQAGTIANGNPVTIYGGAIRETGGTTAVTLTVMTAIASTSGVLTNAGPAQQPPAGGFTATSTIGTTTQTFPLNQYVLPVAATGGFNKNGGTLRIYIPLGDTAGGDDNYYTEVTYGHIQDSTHFADVNGGTSRVALASGQNFYGPPLLVTPANPYGYTTPTSASIEVLAFKCAIGSQAPVIMIPGGLYLPFGAYVLVALAGTAQGSIWYE